MPDRRCCLVRMTIALVNMQNIGSKIMLRCQWGQRWLRRHYRRSLLFFSTLLIVLSTALPAEASLFLAQLPGSSGGSSNPYVLETVELGGLDVFQVAVPNSGQSQRRQQVQENLEEIRDTYLAMESPDANITTPESEDGQPQIYVNGQYLMTITQEDTSLRGMTTTGVVKHLQESITETLERAYQHRQPEYRRQQYLIIGIVSVLVIALMIGLSVISDRLVRSTVRTLSNSINADELNENQQHQIRDLRDRMLPLVQGLLLAGTIIWAMGRFPETRVLQQELLSTLKVPIILGIVVVIAYVGIRLTYAVVNNVAMELTDESGFSSNYSRRARLRISTLSSVIKNIANFVWIGIGFVVALAVTGINLGVLLASVGIIGLALSLAAQNLVQGALKGFFIVLEDQFAIGDIVKIGEDAGLVEKLNLRITQLRDTSGRLITIPTSDINRVANYSLHWSQADLKIPVHYNADIDKMLTVAREVGEELQGDPDWSNLILDDPQILGIDDFGDSAIIIRVWIKTEPMKQWDVSREFRRRFKHAVEAAGTEIPFPQRDVWLHPSEDFRVALLSQQENGQAPQSAEDDRQTSNGAKTDRQPSIGVPDEGEAAEAGEAQN